MADDISAAWRRVGDELSGLGLKLKLHFEQERSEEMEDDEPLFDRLESAVDAVIDAVENAAGDEAVKEDLRETKRLLSDAVRATYRQARRNLETTES